MAEGLESSRKKIGWVKTACRKDLLRNIPPERYPEAPRLNATCDDEFFALLYSSNLQLGSNQVIEEGVRSYEFRTHTTGG